MAVLSVDWIVRYVKVSEREDATLKTGADSKGLLGGSTLKLTKDICTVALMYRDARSPVLRGTSV